jgi:membrane protein DedA with SNARE-associated domain
VETVFQWVSQYGYAGIFAALVLGIVGLPVPDETLLTFAGYLVYRGHLQLAPTLATAFLGSACGISVSYALGYTTGYYLIRKHGSKLHITQESVDRVHRWFTHLGSWTLTFGYYVPGVRHLTAMVAGASKLEYPRFALFAYAGALVWSASFILTGYLVGERWHHVSGQMHWWLLATVAVVAALALGYFLWMRFRQRRRERTGLLR